MVGHVGLAVQYRRLQAGSPGAGVPPSGAGGAPVLIINVGDAVGDALGGASAGRCIESGHTASAIVAVGHVGKTVWGVLSDALDGSDGVKTRVADIAYLGKIFAISAIENVAGSQDARSQENG